MQSENYYIANDKGEYWSETWGWTIKAKADIFKDIQPELYDLPDGLAFESIYSIH